MAAMPMPSSPSPATAQASPWKSRIGYSGSSPRNAVTISTAMQRQNSVEVRIRFQAGQSASIT